MNQVQQVLQFLLANERLSARVWDIRNQLKIPVQNTMIYYKTNDGVNKHYAWYFIDEETKRAYKECNDESVEQV